MIYTTTPRTSAQFATAEDLNNFVMTNNFPPFTKEQIAEVVNNPLTDANTYVATVGDKYIASCPNGQKLVVSAWLTFDARCEMFRLRYNKVVKAA